MSSSSELVLGEQWGSAGSMREAQRRRPLPSVVSANALEVSISFKKVVPTRTLDPVVLKREARSYVREHRGQHLIL